MTHYIFLITAVGDAYGGLEHRASTALLCARDDLPYAGMQGMPARYRAFLGLCSHEYFHTWNVKRIKPAAFTPTIWMRELHHPALGLRGLHLVLRRPGAPALRGDRQRTGSNWSRRRSTRSSATPAGTGRRLAESSFDAWTKYYRPDENTPNAVVSYYAKGRWWRWRST
jgi:predicted metalloprotease with PDZ domain